ncbi:MAG: XTP/dITP diphosphatase [Chloroflexi bacterium]|nr:XTP/dITP diphosphatase [Chloroflexota bacterium]MBM4451423.1 XTP/dITP diphosphatase [Chloroflexota bacterium]MBM4453096.1 XTP/dITP diphosphatase [Chloroflexota bacterium]
MRKLLLATTNEGKTRELCQLLNGVPFELVTPKQLGINIDIAEDRASYQENASIKAEAYAQASGLVSLADDSGLEVDALNGEPGIRSARYAGDKANDKDRIEYLLSRLEGVPPEKRRARFVCIIAIAVPGEKTIICQGNCHGSITTEPRGENGFGYDPVFYLAELGKTMAELSPEQKGQVSHRGQAARKARHILEQLAEKVKT